MFVTESAQNAYITAMARTREAGVEHARSRMELIEAERLGAGIDIAVVEMRSALATKLWETCLRQEAEALDHYNRLLLREVERLQRGSHDALPVASTEGHHFCFTSVTNRD